MHPHSLCLSLLVALLMLLSIDPSAGQYDDYEDDYGGDDYGGDEYGGDDYGGDDYENPDYYNSYSGEELTTVAPTTTGCTFCFYPQPPVCDWSGSWMSNFPGYISRYRKPSYSFSFGSWHRPTSSWADRGRKDKMKYRRKNNYRRRNRQKWSGGMGVFERYTSNWTPTYRKQSSKPKWSKKSYFNNRFTWSWF